MQRVLLEVPSPAPATLRLTGPRHHHLVHVLRARPGEQLEVFDGKGTLYPARLLSVDEHAAVLELKEGHAAPSRRPITLVQGLPKGDKLEWILQHGTELGVSAVWPVHAARSVARLPAERAAKRLERWRRIAEEAARQCGRAEVPEVLSPVGLVEAVRTLPYATKVLVLDEAERAQTLGEAFEAVRSSSSGVALVVGPEGGLSDEERLALGQLGATFVTVGRRILRTETASLAALSVLLHLDGELG